MIISLYDHFTKFSLPTGCIGPDQGPIGENAVFYSFFDMKLNRVFLYGQMTAKKEDTCVLG